MSTGELDFSLDGNAPAGWRLDRLEMANWGTFGEGYVHQLVAEGGWTLLVGENGSGKSTAIDALRTLLAPRAALHHSFNDAAGGQKKRDRTLTTYIRGAWATQRDDEETRAAPKFLRKEETPTYLLAVFGNARLQATLTLAQILWVANGKEETPVYLISGGERSISEHLQGLETGRGMKKELERRGFSVRETYKAYREDFCLRMGIPGEGALEIFNQAIGVKEVSDVSVFLRRNLLAPGGATEFIQRQVVPRFSDLESCWNDIGKAERQIELLAPIATAQTAVIEWEAKRNDIHQLQETLQAYYLHRQAQLLRDHLDRCTLELGSVEAERTELEARRTEARDRRDLIKAQFDADETSRLIRDIDAEAKEVRQRASERQKNHAQLSVLLRTETLGDVPTDDVAFITMRVGFTKRLVELKTQREKADDEAHEHGAKSRESARRIKDAEDEWESLQGRQALIPAYLQRIRAALCDEMRIADGELPFAGELMEVRREYSEDWSGAIERLLGGFGVTLLVPERHYGEVARWVNGQRLTNAAGEGVRLAFHRVSQDGPSTGPAANPRMVAGRLNFRDEHPLARWVAAEVQAGFPHVCCLDTGELERERYGLTKDGLIRNGSRHLKDDRRVLGSRRDYVLGWSPEQKMQALSQQIRHEKSVRATTQAAETAARKTAAAFTQRARNIEAANELTGFAAIDFSVEQERLAQLAKQRADLEKSAERREALQRQLHEAESTLRSIEEARDEILKMIDRKTAQLTQFRPVLAETEERLAHEKTRDFRALAAAYGELEGDTVLTHLNIEVFKERAKGSLQGKANNLSGEINKAQSKMIAPMQIFLSTYGEEGKDLQPLAAYAPEFVALHERLEKEGLPRHKERFRDFLNTNLTESIGGLEAQLNDEVKTHRARIDQVNAALKGLDYGEGTFVEITHRHTRDMAVRDFKTRLRDVLGAGLHPDENQRLELYKRIREIVTRFSQEPEWTARVADSRLWLDFSAYEKWRADGTVKDNLDTSTGRSGGQKVRAAFTILAASLLAQYGLADDPARPDSLRLVVVDEVFARTDASNSHRALQLFKRLGFQLLLAAPWKAEARIAEQYVDSFHLTVNPQGEASRIHRATRAQYEAARLKPPAAHGEPR